MPHDDIRTEVREFIRKNFIFNDKKTLEDSESLLDSGTIDSTGVLELITFLEGRFQVKFADNELVGDNFDSVDRIVAFVSRKVTPSS